MIGALVLPWLAAFLASFGCGKSPDEGERILVVAGIQPLGDFVRATGGERVEVLTVVPPGANPHVFDLTPELLRRAEKARALVLIGLGMEYWADKLRANIPNNGLKTLLAGEEVLSGDRLRGAGSLTQPDADVLDAHDHDHRGVNPHVWLDPAYAADIVSLIRDMLSDLEPRYADEFARNTRRYIDSLRVLDSDIKNTIAQWPERKRAYITHHASWDHFALRYGLKQAGVIESIPGKEISARELSHLVDLMRRDSIPAVFGETMSSFRAAELLAAETGARVAILDPLGSPSTAMDYLGLMRYNLRKMDEVFR